MDTRLEDIDRILAPKPCGHRSLASACANSSLPLKRWPYFATVFLPFLLGPGISLVGLALNPCMPVPQSALFGSICGIYLFICIIVLARLWLYVKNVTYCNNAMARAHIKFHYCVCLLEGAFLNIYLIYTWSHSLIAMACSGMCAMFFMAFYAATVVEHHTRYCEHDKDEHVYPGSTYNLCMSKVVWMDFLLIVALLAFYICAFWFDGDLSSRPATACLV
jgi:hypothetical protein